jgi:hypothetical protein
MKTRRRINGTAMMNSAKKPKADSTRDPLR